MEVGNKIAVEVDSKVEAEAYKKVVEALNIYNIILNNLKQLTAWRR